MDSSGKQRKSFKIALVFDAVIMVVFLIINNVTNFGNRSLELTTIYFAASACLIILANILLYYYFGNKRLVSFLDDSSVNKANP